ncbi:MAG: DUF58 domain-containing protein [Synergistaceae bacterium]|jgi:uncharacterized protein (DUF58 family)|nr:DUF58 domain-containing protein [Synergistaceae bacterium]
MIRPTLRAVLLFSLSVPIALLIVSVRGELWYFSLYFPSAVLVLIAADLINALPDRLLRADLRAPDQLFTGRPGVVEVNLAAPRPIVVHALLEQRGDADPPEAVSGTLADGGLSLNLLILPRRRGRVVIDALWLRWHGSLGLVELRRRQAAGLGIDVVPNVKGIREEALRFFSREAEYGVKPQWTNGDGSEFENLRDYAPGMDHRLIDWKSSARRRKILCKEFRQERNHHIVLGFDTGRLMTEPVDGIPKIDHSIRAALLLGWISLRGGDLLGGCGFDVKFRSFIKPGRGMRYFARFQRFTAELAYRTEETNFTLGLAELNSRLKHRALVVLFTEFVDVISAELLIEGLRWMTRKHVIIFVTMRDPMLTRLQSAPPDDFSSIAGAVIADDFLRERSVVLERIARLGVHCLDLPAAKISAALLNRYLMIKGKGLL